MRICLWLAVVLIGLTAAARSEETLAPETLLPSHEQRDAYAPGAAFGKDVFLVAWQSGRLPEGDMREGLVPIADLVGCRVDKSGKVLDAQPFAISAAPDAQERPRIAFGANIFLVVWHDLRNQKDWDVYAARVTPEGKVLDKDGILVSGGPRSQCLPQVTWDGKTFVVVWQDLRSNKWYEVYAARVSSDGKVLDPQGIKLISRGDMHRFSPAVASAGNGRSVVVCHGNRFGYSGGPFMARAALTDGVAGAALDYPDPADRKVGPSKGCNPLSLAESPQKNCLVAWTTMVPGGRGNASAENNCAIFDAEGKRVTELLTLSGKPHNIIAPQLAWDGSGFVAAWAEQVAPQGKLLHDVLWVMRLSADGKPSGGVLAVSGTPESPARSAAIASDGAGTSLIAYEKHPEKAEVPIKIGIRVLIAK